MNIDIKNKWISDLRSGNYEQGKRELYNEETNSFCCLGVLHYVTCGNPITNSKDREAIQADYDELKELMPAEHYEMDVFYHMNDAEKENGGKNFVEIADWIEKNVQASD